MKKEIHEYWNNVPPTPQAMTIIKNTDTLNQAECSEILSYLPSLQNQKILELAAGIGRFTGTLAQEAAQVTAVDFAPHLIEKNKEDHRHLSNIEYLTANAMDLKFENEQFDTVFINWLFMYLSDEETEVLMERIFHWIKPGGIFFFRESIHAEGRYVYGKKSAIYRQPKQYSKLARSHFNLLKHDIVLTYFLQCKLSNQYFWLCQKS